LTQLLFGALSRSRQGRIINLSSSVYTVGKFDEGNLQSEKRFSVLGAYAASKLFVLLSSLELAERADGSGITVNGVHPGIVRTQMMLRAPGLFRLISWLALPFAISPEKGAAAIVQLASASSYDKTTGLYFASGKPAIIKSAFNTPSFRRRLWEISERSLRERGLLTQAASSAAA
jgi:NAD(P)-dependent dehydrogenase (short-subunit alcohol dehydrogenase family)